MNRFSNSMLGCVGLVLIVGCSSVAQAPAAQEFTTADYARAERLLPRNLVGKVKNLKVEPHWVGDDGEFWYRRDTAAGHDYVFVDAAAGTKEPLFDHAAMASALSTVLNDDIAAEALPLDTMNLAADKASLTAIFKGKLVSCGLGSMSCTAEKVSGPPPDILVSPDGKWGAFARDDNLWLRDMATGDIKPLTEDGEPYFSYGKTPDLSLVTIRLRKAGRKLPPYGGAWSPDSRMLISARLDERKVGDYPFVEWAPQSGAFRPVYHNLRIPILGDADQPITSFHIFNIETGRSVEIDVPEPLMLVPDLVIGWRQDGIRFLVLAESSDQRIAQILEVDSKTGKTRLIIEESAETNARLSSVYYDTPNVRIVNDGEELVIYSRRSGWGQLYLYDGNTGALKNPITQGEWIVWDIIDIDEDRRLIYFTAGGREDGRNPYYRHLYRVGLDGSGLTLLTPENADHQIDGILHPAVRLLRRGGGQRSMSPNLDYFVDTYSTVNQEPVSVLRSTEDGAVIAELEQADAAALYEAGWRPPEPFVVKAADGVTDLYGIMYRPGEIASGTERSRRRYPVIDAIYGGPQSVYTPRNFAGALTHPGANVSLAELGFVLVTLDARGTPLRSKAFEDAGYGDFAKISLADHVAAIQQLSERFSFIDETRAGIFGHSFGGYVSARAILLYPDFFKVAVSSAGAHNFHSLYPGIEPFIGMPVYSDGTHVRPSPTEVPEDYKAYDNAALVENLRGKLMLVYGDLDENVPPSQALQFANTLIEANKPFDLVYLPNRTHGFFGADTYYRYRMWDYFITHLQGGKPPGNYPPAKPPRPARTR